MAIHSTILVWEILWTKEPGRLLGVSGSIVHGAGSHGAGSMTSTNRICSLGSGPRVTWIRTGCSSGRAAASLSPSGLSWEAGGGELGAGASGAGASGARGSGAVGSGAGASGAGGSGAGGCSRAADPSSPTAASSELLAWNPERVTSEAEGS